MTETWNEQLQRKATELADLTLELEMSEKALGRARDDYNEIDRKIVDLEGQLLGSVGANIQTKMWHTHAGSKGRGKVVIADHNKKSVYVVILEPQA